MTRWATPEALAHAAFRAHLAGDSRALSAMTHPEAAVRYYHEALDRLAGWIRLEQIQSAVESGALTAETAGSIRYEAAAPIDHVRLYHLRGVREYGELRTLEPADFLERAFAAGAEIFGRPSQPSDVWQRRERFEIRESAEWREGLARVAYIHTQSEPDGPDTTHEEELIAKHADGAWWLYFDRELFTPLSLLLRA